MLQFCARHPLHCPRVLCRVDSRRLGRRTRRNNLVVRTWLRISAADSRVHAGGGRAPARVRPRQYAGDARIRRRLVVHDASVGARTRAGRGRLYARAVHRPPQWCRSAQRSARYAGATWVVNPNPRSQIPNPKSQTSKAKSKAPTRTANTRASETQRLRDSVLLLGFGLWDLGFGIFQRSDPSIEIGDRLFEHRTVRRCAGALQIGERARSCQ
jgi:hypothetical protein